MLLFYEPKHITTRLDFEIVLTCALEKKTRMIAGMSEQTHRLWEGLSLPEVYKTFFVAGEENIRRQSESHPEKGAAGFSCHLLSI